MIVFILAVLGLAAGSLADTIVWRTRQTEPKAESRKPKAEEKKLGAWGLRLGAQNREFSILFGRSQCEKCGHKLAAGDLVPVFSWLTLRGRCRYCQKRISWHYPVIEVLMAGLFLASYYFWPASLGLSGQKILFATWLISLVGLVALAIYDLRWRLLPTKIIYSTAALALAGRLGYIIFYSGQAWPDLAKLAASIATASGVFYLLYELSKGQWLGFGDVRLGLLTGSLLADPALSLLMIFLASLGGSLTALPLLASGRKKFSSQLPYGPFLIAATFITFLFGQNLINWYQGLLA